MHPKIKELATQAGMKESALGYGMPENVLWGESNIERFAELLINECVNRLEDEKMGAPTPISAGLNFAQVVLKDHFGRV
jgi:hypothetical protein